MSAQLQRLPVAQPLLQFLVTCPSCGKTSAAHLDVARHGVDRVVRLVCPDACPLSAADLEAVAALAGEFDLAESASA